MRVFSSTKSKQMQGREEGERPAHQPILQIGGSQGLPRSQD